MTTKQANTAIISEADAYAVLREVPQIGEEAAKSMARAITLKSEVATKTDIADLRVEIEKSRTETAQMESRMAQMESRMAQMESRLLRWFVSITVLGWGMMIAAMSLIIQLIVA